MLSAAGGSAGKSPPQRSPEHVCDCHETQRTQRDRGKEKTSRDGFELAGELRRGFALRDPQDCGFRFGDGVQLASEMNQIGCARRQSGPQATLIITWRNQDVTTTLMNPETRMERPEVGGPVAIHSGLPCVRRCGGWHAHCGCRLRAGNRDNPGLGDPSRAPLKSKKTLPRRLQTRYNNLMSWPSVYRPILR